MMRGMITVALLAIALLLPACGDDPAPALDIPSWAKVAPEQVAEAKKHGVPVAFENDLGMRFVLIPAGTFMMGSPGDEVERDLNEMQHEATITRPFYMQISEVANGQYRRFDPDHSNEPCLLMRQNGDDQPAMGGHTAARHFAAWASAQDAGRSYRLPSEAEWEFACRAGTLSRFWWGDDGVQATQRANVADKSFYDAFKRMFPDRVTHVGESKDGFAVAAPVASFLPNPWGLYDMHGNAWEWCADWHEAYPRPVAAHDEKDGAWHRERRAMRGGSYQDHCDGCRAARRIAVPIDIQLLPRGAGFRLVSPLPTKNE